MCNKVAISECLKALGYHLMASHALETNVEMLKGYARIIEYKATLNRQDWILERLAQAVLERI